MALETLEGVKEIGGFKVAHDVESEFVVVYHNNNGIYFKIQDGPIKEKGVNGCQVDTIIEAAKLIVTNLNKNFPCRENALAITKLDEALMWLRERKREREARGVEGYNKK